MQRRVILVVSETAVSAASAGKKKRNILCQTVAKRVQESKNRKICVLLDNALIVIVTKCLLK